MKMKAIYLEKYGKADTAFAIRETEIPVPKDDEILIKVQYSGLNFADVIARRGLYPDAPNNPAVLGYDVSGEIAALGRNIKDYHIGQKVVAMTRFGGYAEYAITNLSGIRPIPKGYDLAKATVLATQACTAYYCACDCTTLHKGDTVLIQAAAGGVGSILVQIAKSKGCFVYGTASGHKQEFIKSLGVDVAIDYTKTRFDQVIRERGDELDVVFDSLGGTAFGRANKLLAPGGKMICFGAAEQMDSVKNKFKLISLALGFGLFSPISLLMQSKSIITVNMLRIADFKPDVFNHVFENVVKMAEEGVINPTVSQIFPAAEIAKAHDFLESRKSTGKLVLQWHD
jgi:NADPH2:quinone reductase